MLARESTLSRVQVVELVGVTSGDDVVAEVGAALGVRGSVTSHRALTPRQQADVREHVENELREAVEAGSLQPQPVAALAHVLMGALDEAALYVATADDQDAARAEVGAVIDRLLGSLA